MKKLPAKFELAFFALLLSGLMSFIVSGVALMRNLGAMPEWAAWIHAWLSSWLVAFPSVILIAPLVRKSSRGGSNPNPKIKLPKILPAPSHGSFKLVRPSI